MLAAVVALAGVVRAALLGISVSRDTVTVRAWVWTFRLPVEAIDHIGEQPYSGLVVAWGMRPRRFRELVISTGQRRLAFPFTVASERGIERQVAFLAQHMRLE